MKLNNVMSSLESLEKMYRMSLYASGLPLVKTYAVAEREPQELELMMMTVSDLKVTSMSIIVMTKHLQSVRFNYIDGLRPKYDVCMGRYHIPKNLIHVFTSLSYYVCICPHLL